MTIDDFKFTKENWYDTFTLGKERGVRSKGGFICMLPKPTHYSGQDERYENELDENKANAKLIAAAPKLLDALIKAMNIVDLWTLSEDVAEEHKDEAIILNEMRLSFEKAINEAIS